MLLKNNKKKKVAKLQKYDLKIFIGKNYLRYDRSQSFLIFQLIFKTFKMPASLTNTILEWESKGLSNENIRPPTTANNSLFPKLRWTNN